MGAGLARPPAHTGNLRAQIPGRAMIDDPRPQAAAVVNRFVLVDEQRS